MRVLPESQSILFLTESDYRVSLQSPSGASFEQFVKPVQVLDSTE